MSSEHCSVKHQCGHRRIWLLPPLVLLAVARLTRRATRAAGLRMLAALMLALAGVDPEAIGADYAETDEERR